MFLCHNLVVSDIVIRRILKMSLLFFLQTCLAMDGQSYSQTNFWNFCKNLEKSRFLRPETPKKSIIKETKGGYNTRSKQQPTPVHSTQGRRGGRRDSDNNYADLFHHVTQIIKKQDTPVEKICNAVYSYKAFLRGEYFQNPRILIYGPSGCGKTAIVSEIAKKIKIPFYSIDASSLTGAGYKGFNLTDAIKTILIQCEIKGENEEEIVIFFDEIDKLFAQTMIQDSTPGSVLSELLVFMEKGMEELNFSTQRVLLFFAGAFHQVEITKTQKMFKEFFGRITNIIEVKKLKFDDFKDILLTSTDSPLIVMKKELERRGRSLEITPEAINYIAHYSEKRGTGSRALKFAMHELLQPYFGKWNTERDIIITEKECERLFGEFMNDDSDMPPRGMYI